MTIKPPYNRNREIVCEDGSVLNHAEQMNLASKVIDMIINGEIEPIKTEKVSSGSIQGTKLNTYTKG